MAPRVLITGAAGYLGAHASLRFLQEGLDVTAVDDLSTGSLESLLRVQQLAGRSLNFVRGDVRNADVLQSAFDFARPQAVLHFAGVKSVRESFVNPLHYYSVNVSGTLFLLEAMRRAQCRRLIYSSSATVYGATNGARISETAILSPESPYGRSKAAAEAALLDASLSEPDFEYVVLRYFNPVGAHESGLIGDASRRAPTNLMPLLSAVATGRNAALEIFGDDWPTPDGTCIRDYLHVDDLTEGHWLAYRHLAEGRGSIICNLGTGRGQSVQEIVSLFEQVIGRPIPVRRTARRAGDVAALVADPTRARDVLRWTAARNVFEMCRDHWNWHQRNPLGYETA